MTCVRAYNDALAEFRRVSDRFIPLAAVPYMSSIETIVGEVESAVKAGHMGINMLADPSVAVKGLRKISAILFWHPLWNICQESWRRRPFTRVRRARWKVVIAPMERLHAATVALRVDAAQFLHGYAVRAVFDFSGMLDKFPRLNWVFAETGLGWVSSVLEACDCEWEKRHLWTEGILTRPSELFRRQIYVDFWFETVGIQLRDCIGIDNILWESDFPHITSTYPNSWMLSSVRWQEFQPPIAKKYCFAMPLGCID